MDPKNSLNQVKRFETDVILRTKFFHIKHRGVVYHVRTDGDTEAILLAENHRWRDGYLMVVMRNKDMDSREARELINDYVNGNIWCQECHNMWDGAVSFRVDLKNGRIVRAVCAYCDTTVDDMVKAFDRQEAQIRGG